MSLTTDTSTSVYASGIFQYTVDFDPCTTTQTLTAVDQGLFGDVFLLKLVPMAAPQVANVTPPPGQLICDGSTTTLSATSQGTVSWLDSSVYTGTVLNTGTSLTTPTLGTGTYSYYVMATDNCGIGNPAAIVITVSAIPDVTVSASNSAICSGQSSTISVSGASSYAWSNGSTSSVVVVNPAQTTDYTIFGINPGSCTNSAVFELTVTALPEITVSASADAICTGQNATLNLSGASSYSWSNGSAGAMVVVNPTVTTNYTITGINSGNCINSSAYTLTVSTCLGLNSNLSGNELFVYPDPNPGELKLSASGDDSYSIELYDGTDRLVLHDQISSKQALTLSGLPNGILLYVIRLNDQPVKTGKLILSKF